MTMIRSLTVAALAMAALPTAVRAQGYAVSFSTLYKGVASVAAPVRDRDGRVAAAVNCTVLEGVVERAVLEGAYRESAVEAAAKISSDLGFSADDIEPRVRA